jgi:hypothetical protein
LVTAAAAGGVEGTEAAAHASGTIVIAAAMWATHRPRAERIAAFFLLSACGYKHRRGRDGAVGVSAMAGELP